MGYLIDRMRRPQLVRRLMPIRILTSLGLAALSTSPAQALCIYNGVDNVETTIEQEFRDSPWVVRAHVVSVDYHWSDKDESWAFYRLKVVERFKGDLSERFTFFTMRNSGGFYMDADGGGPDLDGDYLLFLTPRPWPRYDPPIAKGALWVNYNCGQSKAWSKVTQDEHAQLRELSATSSTKRKIIR